MKETEELERSSRDGSGREEEREGRREGEKERERAESLELCEPVAPHTAGVAPLQERHTE